MGGGGRHSNQKVGDSPDVVLMETNGRDSDGKTRQSRRGKVWTPFGPLLFEVIDWKKETDITFGRLVLKPSLGTYRGLALSAAGGQGKCGKGDGGRLWRRACLRSIALWLVVGLCWEKTLGDP